MNFMYFFTIFAFFCFDLKTIIGFFFLLNYISYLCQFIIFFIQFNACFLIFRCYSSNLIKIYWVIHFYFCFFVPFKPKVTTTGHVSMHDYIPIKLRPTHHLLWVREPMSRIIFYVLISKLHPILTSYQSPSYKPFSNRLRFSVTPLWST